MLDLSKLSALSLYYDEGTTGFHRMAELCCQITETRHRCNAAGTHKAAGLLLPSSPRYASRPHFLRSSPPIEMIQRLQCPDDSHRKEFHTCLLYISNRTTRIASSSVRGGKMDISEGSLRVCMFVFQQKRKIVENVHGCFLCVGNTRSTNKTISVC